MEEEGLGRAGEEMGDCADGGCGGVEEVEVVLGYCLYKRVSE